MFSNKSKDRLHKLEAENARLKRSVAELSLLNELALSIGASNDTQEIIQSVIKRVVKSVKAEQGDLMLIKENTQDLLTTFVRTADSKRKMGVFSVHDNLLGWMQLHKKPLLLNKPWKDDRFNNTDWNPAINNLLCVPLMIRSRLIGVLTAYNNQKVPSAFSEEDLRILAIIAAQSAQIIENARLYEEEQALTRMREELRLAQEIQTSLLPQRQTFIPGYEVAGLSKPAQVVGGDFFDVFSASDDHFALCVGDASGKGLPASLFISNVQATLHGQSLGNTSVSSCLKRVNHLLSQRTRKGLFVTLFYGVLEPGTHMLRFANAGHNRPLLRRADGTIETLSLGDIPMGFLSEFSFREDAISFQPGDLLLIYSDGITEAKSSDNSLFEEYRLIQLLSKSNGSPKELIEHIIAGVEKFRREAQQSDDMTLLALRRLP